MTRKIFSRTALAIATVGVVCGASVSDQAQAARLSALEELGKLVFFDPISRPVGNQSCSSCHDPTAGWAGPDSLINNSIVAQPGAAFHSSGGTAITNISSVPTRMGRSTRSRRAATPPHNSPAP